MTRRSVMLLTTSFFTAVPPLKALCYHNRGMLSSHLRRFLTKILPGQEPLASVRRQVCSPTTFSRGALVCVHASPQRCPRSPSAEQRADVRWTSSKMTGATRRAFQAEMPLQDCAGNARVAEAVCGWGRHPVALGRAERRPGGMCLNQTTQHSHTGSSRKHVV